MKTCKKCGNTFETARCVPCRKEYMANYRKENRGAINAKNYEYIAANFNRPKTCGKCGNEYTGKECKPCRNERNAVYNKAHPAVTKKSCDAYRKSFPDRRKAVTDAWIDRNRARRDTVYKRWVENNRHRIKVIQHNRRARVLSGGKLSPGIEIRLYRLQRGKCACCGLPLGRDYHLDHIIPLALSGTNTDSNMQLLRKLCNLKKSAKHPVDYMRSKGFLL